MNALIELLRRKRALLLKAYLVHVGWFASTCAFAAADGSQAGISLSLWLTLLTVPPVLFYTDAVHKACRAIDPVSKTMGWRSILVFTVLLTPLESGLVLPARNLLASRRILRAWDQAAGAPAGRRDSP